MCKGESVRHRKSHMKNLWFRSDSVMMNLDEIVNWLVLLLAAVTSKGTLRILHGTLQLLQTEQTTYHSVFKDWRLLLVVQSGQVFLKLQLGFRWVKAWKICEYKIKTHCGRDKSHFSFGLHIASIVLPAYIVYFLVLVSWSHISAA